MQSKGFGVLLLTFATFFGQLLRHPAINNKLEVCPSLTIVTFQFPSLLYEQQKISCCCAEKLSTWIDDNRCTKNFTYSVRNSISLRNYFWNILFLPDWTRHLSSPCIKFEQIECMRITVTSLRLRCNAIHAYFLLCKNMRICEIWCPAHVVCMYELGQKSPN